jgi:type IV pilus assembly protein PilV
MVDRIHLNHATATCFRFTTDTTTGTPFLGVGSGGAPACTAGTANDNLMATAAMDEWDDLLQGAAETKGGAQAGAMAGARGCVSYNTSSELLDPTLAPIPGTGRYKVAISWMGTIDTFAPADNCGNDNALYGAETRRRVVSIEFRLANLK